MGLIIFMSSMAVTSAYHPQFEGNYRDSWDRMMGENRGPRGLDYSIDSCNEFCTEMDKDYFGLQYGKEWNKAECWCTNNIQRAKSLGTCKAWWQPNRLLGGRVQVGAGL